MTTPFLPKLPFSFDSLMGDATQDFLDYYEIEKENYSQHINDAPREKQLAIRKSTLFMLENVMKVYDVNCPVNNAIRTVIEMPPKRKQLSVASYANEYADLLYFAVYFKEIEKSLISLKTLSMIDNKDKNRLIETRKTYYDLSYHPQWSFYMSGRELYSMIIQEYINWI